MSRFVGFDLKNQSAPAYSFPADQLCLAEPFSASRIIPPYPSTATDVHWARDWGYLNLPPNNYDSNKAFNWYTGASEVAVNAATIALVEY